MTPRALAFVAALGLVVVLTNEAFRERQILRRISERVEGGSRFVDAGVVVRVVTADPKGTVLLEGKPRMRVLSEIPLGGIIDTEATPPQIVEPSANPRVWYCSEDQAAILFHGTELARDKAGELAQLAYGSEGAGKTRSLAMWHYVQWLQALGQYREGGQTAPTEQRLEIVRKEMAACFAPNWFTYLSSENVFIMCDGTRIQLVSTYRQSKAQGSRIQGFNWSWCGRDEAQDQVDVHEDIESRGRSAAGGQYRQLATATAKDDSEWRELRDVLLASGQWVKRQLSIFTSPFVSPEFLATKAKSVSAREFKRRYGDPATGLVDDLPPELAVYYGWIRSRNLVPKPQIATDVTYAVLAPYQSYTRSGARFTTAVGHDPGVIFNTSTVWRLLMFGEVPTWVAVGEMQTEQTTARQHARELRAYLQREHQVELPHTSKAAIFCDPHGKGEKDTDYASVYGAFQEEGLDVFNPVPLTGRIQRAARVEMMNRLLGDVMAWPGSSAIATPRLLVASVNGRPLAPRLVESFESLKKKPGDNDAEGTRRKDENDKTHAPASAGYALWPFEQEGITKSTVRVAIAEARRVLG